MNTEHVELCQSIRQALRDDRDMIAKRRAQLLEQRPRTVAIPEAKIIADIVRFRADLARTKRRVEQVEKHIALVAGIGPAVANRELLETMHAARLTALHNMTQLQITLAAAERALACVQSAAQDLRAMERDEQLVAEQERTLEEFERNFLHSNTSTNATDVQLPPAETTTERSLDDLTRLIELVREIEQEGATSSDSSDHHHHEDHNDDEDDGESVSSATTTTTTTNDSSSESDTTEHRMEAVESGGASDVPATPSPSPPPVASDKRNIVATTSKNKASAK